MSLYNDDRKCATAKETFGQFMRRVDKWLVARIGLPSSDLADCAWWTCYTNVCDVPESDPFFYEEVAETVCAYNEELESILEEVE